MINHLKISTIFIFSLHCHMTCATNSPRGQLLTAPITTTQQTRDNFADLAPGDAIGNKRIVMLDELARGEGNVF